MKHLNEAIQKFFGTHLRTQIHGVTKTEVTDFLYKNFPISIIFIIALATILMLGLINHIESIYLNIWYISVLVILTYRIILFIWYKNTKNRLKLEPYFYYLFIAGSSLSALMWGILGSVLMPTDIPHQTFIIIMISGIIAGAVSSLGISYLTSMIYVVLSIGPTLTWIGMQVLHGTQLYLGIFIAISLYVIYFAIFSWKNSVLIYNNIKLKHQNFELLNNLRIHTQEIELFSELEGLLESCRSYQEIGEFCKQFLPKIFSNYSGAIILYSESNKQSETLITWGDNFLSSEKQIDFLIDDCVAIITNDCYISHGTERCKHCSDESAFYVCAPLQTSSEFYGLLHMKLMPDKIPNKKAVILTQKALILSISTSISLAFSNVRYQDRLRMDATQDVLTGLFNRRYLDDYFKIELARFKRELEPIAIIMLDIDFFKKFNDQFGHEVGDEILKKLGRYLKNSVRGSDFACRFGGEEFILVLPGSDLHIARERAEKIREGVKHLSIAKENITIPGITVSIGIAVFPKQGTTQEDIINAADKALYQAKNEGRDRICIA